MFRKFQLFFQVTVMPMQKNAYARQNLLVLAMPSALMTRSAVCGARYVEVSKEWVKQYFNHTKIARMMNIRLRQSHLLD